MSLPSARRVLLLGGISSGISVVAESLVTGTTALRRVLVAPEASPASDGQPGSPATGTTDPVRDPRRLPDLITAASPEETLLIDGLGGWLTAVLPDEIDTGAEPAEISTLVNAVRGCQAARLVLVSREVGLSLPPAGQADQRLTRVQGLLNRNVADACDAVALVIAGRAIWLAAAPEAGGRTIPAAGGRAIPAAGTGVPGTPVVTPVGETPHEAPDDAAPAGQAPGESGPTGEVPDAAAATGEPADATGEPADATGEPAEATGEPADATEDLPGPDAFVPDEVPATDDDAAAEALDRLKRLDLPGTGLGALTATVRFAAATQGDAEPRAWQNVRVLVLHGEHAGGVCAGDPTEAAERRFADANQGRGPTAVLATAAEATVTAVRCPPAQPIEERDALEGSAVDSALRQGHDLADAAADAGADLLVLAASVSGGDGAAAAVIALISGAEPAMLLPTVARADGTADDPAWMRRCAAIRDALQRVRTRPRDPRSVLKTLGGGDTAVATGLLLGAAARRMPVIIDGPIAAAAAVVAREYAVEVADWLLMPDHGGHPTVRRAAEMLTLAPVLDLGLGLGEGATALVALPVLRAALTVAGTTAIRDGSNPEPPASPAEPEPPASPTEPG